LVPLVYAMEAEDDKFCGNGFEEGAKLFIQQAYLPATSCFLKRTRLNDTRVYAFLDCIHEQKLINQEDLKGSLKDEWHLRREHLPFVPTVLGMGDVYLAVSQLAQRLYEKSASKEQDPSDTYQTIEEICRLSDQNKLGFGYYLVGCFLKDSTFIRSQKNRIKVAIAHFAHGAFYGESACVVELGTVAQDMRRISNNDPCNVYCENLERYRQEAEVLAVKGGGVGVRESLLASLYTQNDDDDNEEDAKPNNVFRQDFQRGGYWQLQATRKGNLALQRILTPISDTVSKRMHLNRKDAPHQKLYWEYFRAIGGDPEAQVLIGMYYYGVLTQPIFEIDAAKALVFFELAIDTYSKKDSQEEEIFFHQALAFAGNILERGEGGVFPNEVEALRYYKLGVKKFESQVCAYNAGVMFARGKGTKTNALRALSYFKRTSKLNTPDVCVLLGVAHIKGASKDKVSLKTGLDYLKKAVQLDNSEARNKECTLFEVICLSITDEKGDVPDLHRAIFYLKQAALNGCVEAQKAWTRAVCGQREKLSREEDRLFQHYLENHFGQEKVMVYHADWKEEL
jgi:TPR repeat protein